MASAPSASWNSRCITHLANCPNRSLPTNSSDESSFEGCCSRPRKEGIEVLIETFIRKQLGLKAHTVTRVEETEDYMIIHIDRLGSRLLRCGLCRQRCRKVHSVCVSRGNGAIYRCGNCRGSCAPAHVESNVRGAACGWRTFPGRSRGRGSPRLCPMPWRNWHGS